MCRYSKHQWTSNTECVPATNVAILDFFAIVPTVTMQNKQSATNRNPKEPACQDKDVVNEQVDQLCDPGGQSGSGPATGSDAYYPDKNGKNSRSLVQNQGNNEMLPSTTSSRGIKPIRSDVIVPAVTAGTMTDWIFLAITDSLKYYELW